MKVYIVLFCNTRYEDEVVGVFKTEESAKVFVDKTEDLKRNSSIIEWEVAE